MPNLMVPYVACLKTAGPILENSEEIHEQFDVSHKTAIHIEKEHKTIPDPTLYLKPFLLEHNLNLSFKI